MKMVEGPIVEAAPSDAAGVGVLRDGWFRFFPFQLGQMIDGDLLTTINGINAAAVPNMLEVIFTGPILFAFEPPDFETDVALGWTSPPSNHGGLASLLQDNTYVLMAPNLELNLRTLAHEIGHALTNQGDNIPVPYVFFPFQADQDVPLIGDADPKDFRRIRHATEAAARTVRQQLNEIGNVLLAPVEEDDEP